MQAQGDCDQGCPESADSGPAGELPGEALAGAGLVRVPSWQVAHYLADGRLKVVLEAYQRPPTPLSVLTLRNRLLLPKVRAFADFLQHHWMRPRPPL